MHAQFSSDAYAAFNHKSDLEQAGSTIGLLHVNAGLLVERYLRDCDPCVGVWLSRQFRLISDNPGMPDNELKVLYRTLAARWHQIATQGLRENHPGRPWLDEFPQECMA